VTYRLVATDLDGTLLRSDHTLSARTHEALVRMSAQGVRHVVVTGRAAVTTRPILDQIGYQGLAVCGQGGQLYDAGAHRLLTSVTLDRALARELLRRLEAVVGPLRVGVIRADLDGQFFMQDGFVWDFPLPAEHLRDDGVLWAEPILKVFVQHAELADDELAEVAGGLAGSRAGVVVSGPRLVELLPAGVSKGTGLSLAARRLGVTAGETVAFGDMPNDLPMLRWAGLGVAMASGHPDLVAAADEVAPSNDEDGVAAVLDRLFP
jgi:Cof subfamily protein (haloacid dehalogenase superfamily)